MYVQCVIDLCTCLLMAALQGDCLGHRRDDCALALCTVPVHGDLYRGAAY